MDLKIFTIEVLSIFLQESYVHEIRDSTDLENNNQNYNPISLKISFQHNTIKNYFIIKAFERVYVSHTATTPTLVSFHSITKDSQLLKMFA